jgi:DNA polymerase-3 subunit alpha
VYDLGTIRKRYAKALRLACNGGADGARLQELLAPFRPGTCPVVLEYRAHGVCGEIAFPETWAVNPDDTLIAQLRAWLAPENVQVVY